MLTSIATAAGSTLPASAGAARAPVLAPVLLMALIVTLQFGPLISLLGFLATDDPVFALGGGLRDGLVLVLLALAVLARLGAAHAAPALASTGWALLFVAATVAMALVSRSEFWVTALNFRRLALVPLLVVAILWLPWSARQIDRAFALIVATSLLVVLSGFAERLAPEALWTDTLKIEAFTAANGFDKFGRLAYHTSGRFFSWDLAWLTGGPWRRMVSTYLEPTTLAAGLAALLCFALARHARGHPSMPLVLCAIAGGTLTLSKGFLLFLPLLLFWLALGSGLVQYLVALVVLIATLATAVALGNELTGAFVHVEGLATGVSHLLSGNWLGEGLGVAGGLSNDHVEAGHESGFGTLLAQVGVAGFLHLGWVLALAADVTQASRRNRDPGGKFVASWLIFWTVTYLLSSSSLGVGGNAIGFMGIALYLKGAHQRVGGPAC